MVTCRKFQDNCHFDVYACIKCQYYILQVCPVFDGGRGSLEIIEFDKKKQEKKKKLLKENFLFLDFFTVLIFFFFCFHLNKFLSFYSEMYKFIFSISFF